MLIESCYCRHAIIRNIVGQIVIIIIIINDIIIMIVRTYHDQCIIILCMTTKI